MCRALSFEFLENKKDIISKAGTKSMTLIIFIMSAEFAASSLIAAPAPTTFATSCKESPIKKAHFKRLKI